MLKIRQLPERLANKIAAGEVVERPASVVKELLENSIDANSTIIDIELAEAGLAEIKVTDNGDGMNEADSKRAFLRHATSKIIYDQDLFHIESLGFRGEALASIASVSKLTIKTSLGDEAGTKLYLEGGKIVNDAKSDARKGTEITVHNLFYNTPARLKYVKSIHTELSHITDMINRYALAHPSIRFSVSHNGKSIFQTSGSKNQLQVISQIYGMNVAKNMLSVKGETIDYDIAGYIGKPEITRSNRNFITVIVNGRFIKSPALTHAILRAYDTLLPIHRYPICVLDIRLDPILVDVNVHPTKLEVRFSKEKELIELIERMIRDAFKKQTLIPEAKKRPKQDRKKERTEQAIFSFVPDKEMKSADMGKPLEFSPRQELSEAEEVKETREIEFQDVPPIPASHIIEMDEGVQKSERIPAMYPIGQLQGTYILAQNETGFYMIDQHAAQERIKYEFYKEALAKPDSDMQQLLFPMTFEFTANEISFIEKHRIELEQAGLFLEPFGDNTYAARAYPGWFPKGMEEEIIRDLVDQIIHEGKIDIGKLREEVAILMSCKRSIKANHYLNEQDMARLLEDLRKTDDPFTCPHGRPVIIHFTFYEIEKMFKRIM